MSTQQLDHPRGVLTVHAHPRVERAHAPQREEAVEWSTSNPQTVRPPRQLLDHRWIRRYDGTADDVAVSVQILGGRVHHEVRAELDRTL